MYYCCDAWQPRKTVCTRSCYSNPRDFRWGPWPTRQKYENPKRVQRSDIPSSSPVSLDLSLAISRSTFSFTASSSSALSDVLSIVRKDSLLNIVSLHYKSQPMLRMQTWHGDIQRYLTYEQHIDRYKTWGRDDTTKTLTGHVMVWLIKSGLETRWILGTIIAFTNTSCTQQITMTHYTTY